MALDFRGGTLMYVRFDPKPPIDELRQRALGQTNGRGHRAGRPRAPASSSSGPNWRTRRSSEQARQAVEQTLRDKYANLGGKLDLNNASQAALRSGLRMHCRPRV